MKELGLNEIREKFLTFFEGKSHLRIKSFPLIPQNDKSLLLINAGMVPLKPFFTGQEIPPSNRVVSCQKCIRTNDIDNVGVTSRHGSFFEMLGNFSFGDYFKKEVIPWAWEFITHVLEIPEDKIYISIYLDDDEAYDIWLATGVPADRITRLGRDDNFWEVGMGPCGPCSELHYDRGPEFGCGSPDCAVGCDCDRFIEIWNLVFTQFNKEEDGSYSKLSRLNIDTGMGLERIACVMQGVNTLFDVDTIRAIRDKVCALTGISYGADAKNDISVRIITDHIRSVTFMTADGVLPSNEGRGYVLRRLLRRAARHGKLLGLDAPFLTELSDVVIEVSGAAYPELIEKRDYVFKIISVEESKFMETIDAGMEILQRRIKDGLRGVFPGEEAFRLYDTFGFPIELMEEILSESGVTIDTEGFKNAMEVQKERARAARGESNYMGAEETVFNRISADITSEYTGAESMKLSDALIRAITGADGLADKAEHGDEITIILDRTPFYAESGGQRGDIGMIRTAGGEAKVTDCKKVTGNRIAHICVVTKGSISLGESAEAEVDQATRMDTSRNHTATHLLQKALRTVLGTHVEQAGSNVGPERLRFDFTHFSPMTADEIKDVETIVNEYILDSIEVCVSEQSMEEARKIGAMALFGEKYGQTVRVVDIGGESIELCGGTHLKNTAQVGSFKIIAENGIASGVRRIEALTGRGVLEYYSHTEDRLAKISEVVKATPDNLLTRIIQISDRTKELEAELSKARAKMSAGVVDDMISAGEIIGEVTFIAAQTDGIDMDGLKELGDKIKNRVENVVAVLASAEGEGKVNLLVMSSDSAVGKGIHAGNIIKEVAATVGGKGGGRSNMAQAGGKDPQKIGEALEKAKDYVKSLKSKI